MLGGGILDRRPNDALSPCEHKEKAARRGQFCCDKAAFGLHPRHLNATESLIFEEGRGRRVFVFVFRARLLQPFPHLHVEDLDQARDLEEATVGVVRSMATGV